MILTAIVSDPLMYLFYLQRIGIDQLDIKDDLNQDDERITEHRWGTIPSRISRNTVLSAVDHSRNTLQSAEPSLSIHKA